MNKIGMFVNSRLAETESLCPVCLAVLPAAIKRRGEEVFICRTCPEHGLFEEVIWRGNPSFESWRRPKQPVEDLRCQSESVRGCPFDCGLCPNHGQHSCTVLLEITGRCNLRCPVCFADSGKAEPDFIDSAVLIKQMHWIKEQAGDIVLQLSGGEPTLHPQLAELTAAAAEIFPAVQLNTNGLLLAEDPQLAGELAQAGLSWVFLQFDGVSEATFKALRGRALMGQKLAAIKACEKAGLSVVMVPTVAAGINDGELGELFSLALSLSPTVRGVHIQPMTTSGRNNLPGVDRRLTLPEVLMRLHEQTGGLVKPEDAFPPGCEHERCSFQIRYRRDEHGELRPLSGGSCCARKTTSEPTSPEETAENTRRSVDVTIKSWSKPFVPLSGSQSQGDAFDEFLARASRETFSLTCMAFQDVWTVDLARLRGCCVHIFRAPGRLIPFCAMNLTNSEGHPLHRHA